MNYFKQINFDTNRKNFFSISVKKPPLFAQFGLIFTMMISLLMPIAILTFMLINRAELKIGLFVSFAIFWGIGYFLFRVWTWNQNGKEMFEIGNDKIIYYADFKYFKDSHQQIDKKDVRFEINEMLNGKERYVQLLINNDKEEIESCINVEPNELKRFIEQLNYALNKKETRKSSRRSKGNYI